MQIQNNGQKSNMTSYRSDKNSIQYSRRTISNNPSKTKTAKNTVPDNTREHSKKLNKNTNSYLFHYFSPSTVVPPRINVDEPIYNPNTEYNSSPTAAIDTPT